MTKHYIAFRRFTVAALVLAAGILLAAAVATLYLDSEPKVITLLFGLAAGFALGSLVGLWFVGAAINGILDYVRTGRLAR